MFRQLFQLVDPHILDGLSRIPVYWEAPSLLDPRVFERWANRDRVRRRKISRETILRLSLLRRSLQALPPRELQFIYLVKVKGLIQEETRRIYSVKQQNISYRLNKAFSRLGIHYKILTTASETQLRKRLFDIGLNFETVSLILGLLKTTSYTATAEAFGKSSGSVHYAFSKSIGLMESKFPNSKEFELLKIIERNLNQLRGIKCQPRWARKRGQDGSQDTPVNEFQRLVNGEGFDEGIGISQDM